MYKLYVKRTNCFTNINKWYLKGEAISVSQLERLKQEMRKYPVAKIVKVEDF